MFRILVAALFLSSFTTVGVLAQAQPGGVFQPPEEQRRLGLPDKAAPAQTVPVQPLPSAPRRAAPSTPPVVAPKASGPATERQSAEVAASASGEWASECVDKVGADSRSICQAIVRSSIGGQIAVVLAVARAPESGLARLQMALPLGFDVQRAVEIHVGGYDTTIKVSRCTAQGCLIEETAPKGLIDALRKEPAGKVRVYTVDGKAIDIALPLKGAAKALADFSDG